MRIRQHVNPLGLVFEDLHARVPELPPGCEVELEIGCADAQFLFERAARDPSRVYVGLEIREPLVDSVNRAAKAQGLPVHALFCHANLHLDQLFDPGTVTRVYLNFPDPWFKSRHRKRRMIDDGLARAVHRLLIPGGEVFIQSDVWDVALDALDVFERLDHLYENQAGAWSFWKRGNPYGARSWREQHCEEAGLPIWRIRYLPRPAR
ncbi:tRNA (guanine(46)-N(7))-methyltransferase TrmB [Haliangium sp.]|uniref:tRNA (guanine(46)-N(7))-methyltransferase TrmB n=1 Tax=Haliangium sp. TaxID=2663208 RepID=UPI003D141DD7